MSTRCRIGMKQRTGAIKSVYCHHDGYIEGPHGVGYELNKYYQDPKDIEALIDGGNMSSLGETVKDCNYYCGDDEKARIDVDEEVFIDKLGWCGEEYTYLFKEDYTGVYRWHVYETPYGKPLDEVLGGKNDY